MLLNSVIIVLREVLEATLLLSVFLATAVFLKLGKSWAVVALSIGTLGAIAYGLLLEPVSDLFDGVGQEIVNAFLQFGAFVCLAAAAYFVGRRTANPHTQFSILTVMMAAAVSLAITREGSEILVYVSGFWNVSDVFSAVGAGSLIGASIGFSVGVLIYYLLVAQPPTRALPVSVILLLLIAAGMASQATRLLIQADWISTSGALWNTSAILSEESLLGQLLYALLGYEASPAAIEVAVHLGSIFLVAAVYSLGRFMRGTDPEGLG